jgi:hypothetical protein
MEPRFNRAILEAATVLEAPAPAQLFAYWQRKCAERTRPRWSDFELMDLWEISRYIVVKDVMQSERDFRFRYWGSGMTDITGIDGSGKLASQLYASDAYAHVLAAFWQAIDEGIPIRVAGNATIKGKEHLAYEAIHLPLDNDANAIGHLISGYSFVPTCKPADI